MRLLLKLESKFMFFFNARTVLPVEPVCLIEISNEASSHERICQISSSFDDFFLKKTSASIMWRCGQTVLWISIISLDIELSEKFALYVGSMLVFIVLLS